MARDDVRKDLDKAIDDLGYEEAEALKRKANKQSLKRFGEALDRLPWYEQWAPAIGAAAGAAFGKRGDGVLRRVAKVGTGALAGSMYTSMQGHAVVSKKTREKKNRK